MTTLKDIYTASRDEEYQVKLAAVSEAYDDERVALLDRAVDIVKQAEAAGEIPEQDACGILTLAVQLVEDACADAGQEKVASDDDDEDDDDDEKPKAKKDKKAAPKDKEDADLSKEAAEQVTAMGERIGQILAERGITAEDLEKIASEEEAETLGRYCAHALLETLVEEATYVE